MDWFFFRVLCRLFFNILSSLALITYDVDHACRDLLFRLVLLEQVAPVDLFLFRILRLCKAKDFLKLDVLTSVLSQFDDISLVN